MYSSDYRSAVFLRVVGCDIRIECRDPRAVELLRANYGAMQVSEPACPVLEYTVARRRNGSAFHVTRCGGEPLEAADNGEFLFIFEKDLTIELQKWRRDLYFIHAAALAIEGHAILLTAASGQGKSTTSWALLHHGFGYLSDELAPLELPAASVQPYPHAICLKAEPPERYRLPAATLRTPSTLHIPVDALPNRAVSRPLPLAAIFFLELRRAARLPSLKRIGQAEAAARLFTQALNPLAHPDDGLAAAASIVRNAACFCLESGDLELMSRVIETTLAPLIRR